MHHEHVVEEEHFSLVVSRFLFATDVRYFIQSTVADKAPMQQCQLLTKHIVRQTICRQAV